MNFPNYPYKVSKINFIQPLVIDIISNTIPETTNNIKTIRKDVI